jgi:hypothetical protein
VLTLVIVIVVLGTAAVVLSAPLVLHRLEPYLLSAPGADATGPLSEPSYGTSPFRDAPYNERDRVLGELSELEHSRSQGKVTDIDYAVQRERLEREYLRVAGNPSDGK